MARVVQQLNDDLFGKKAPPVAESSASTTTPEQIVDQQYDDLWKRMERGTSDQRWLQCTNYLHLAAADETQRTRTSSPE
jgi:hypothetical protein